MTDKKSSTPDLRCSAIMDTGRQCGRMPHDDDKHDIAEVLLGDGRRVTPAEYCTVPLAKVEEHPYTNKIHPPDGDWSAAFEFMEESGFPPSMAYVPRSALDLELSHLRGLPVRLTDDLDGAVLLATDGPIDVRRSLLVCLAAKEVPNAPAP